MNRDVYFESLEGVLGAAYDVARNKTPQYNADSSPFQNLEDSSVALGLSPLGYMMALAQKHWHTLVQVAMGRRKENKNLTRERILDVIVYMAMYAVYLEKETDEQYT